jgi:formylglycine-generating enzyme required for sulfatase activity
MGICRARRLEQKIYPWGDELTPGGKHHCNIWQGKFPDFDSGADGYKGLGLVRAFPTNGFGLYNMAGNVWQWDKRLVQRRPSDR